MQIVNTKKKYFIGHLNINNQNVFIDMNTGEGVADILRLVGGLIYKFAYMYSHVAKIGMEDAKQDISLWILEGILKYKQTEGTSLSTFIYTLVSRKIIDCNRKNHNIKDNINIEDYEISAQSCDPITMIDVKKHTSCWDGKWKHIIFRIFLEGEKINDIAASEGMSPWGLTRAVYKKLEEARKIR